MKRYKVRFHLARGDNYMKWQVTDLQQDTKSYFDPNLKSIVMRLHPRQSSEDSDAYSQWREQDRVRVGSM